MMHKSISMPELIVHEIQMDAVTKTNMLNSGICKITKTLSFPKDLVKLGDDDYEYATCLATPIENSVKFDELKRINEKRLIELYVRLRKSLRRTKKVPT